MCCLIRTSTAACLLQVWRRRPPGHTCARRAIPPRDYGVTSEAAAAVASPVPSVPLETASLSRLLVSSVRPAAKTLLSHRLAGPFGVAFVGAYAVALAVGAWRSATARRARDCTSCRGFAIARCDLCEASGFVSWEGKWGHVEPCPACLGKRHVRCAVCGARFGRSLFAHVPRDGASALLELERSDDEDDLHALRAGAPARASVAKVLRAAKHDIAFD
jgi:hypothetical protein